MPWRKARIIIEDEFELNDKQQWTCQRCQKRLCVISCASDVSALKMEWQEAWRSLNMHEKKLEGDPILFYQCASAKCNADRWKYYQALRKMIQEGERVPRDLRSSRHACHRPAKGRVTQQIRPEAQRHPT